MDLKEYFRDTDGLPYAQQMQGARARLASGNGACS